MKHTITWAVMSLFTLCLIALVLLARKFWQQMNDPDDNPFR